MRSKTLVKGLLSIVISAAIVAVVPVLVAETNAEEAPGAYQSKPTEDQPIHICAGCVAPLFTEGSKGSITPYGRIELDALYSTRNTNPLDPQQFNGYGTAAGRQGNSSSSLNPRYSVFGLRADRTDGVRTLTGVVEVDFYGQSDTGNNLPPRLRLAYMKYSPNNGKTSFTIGQDWNPIMGLLNNDIDFSIMGYTGNLWNRIPQVTVRHNFTENWEVLVTAMRFERGWILFNTQSRPTGTWWRGGWKYTAFTDPCRSHFNQWRQRDGNGRSMLAANVYRCTGRRRRHLGGGAKITQERTSIHTWLASR
jgi:hypothetical protein